MSVDPLIVQRMAAPESMSRLVAAGCPPLLARVYAARGIADPEELEDNLERLLRPDSLHNVGQMAELLADAIERNERLTIVADYDADGATACAVAVRALRAFGASVHYVVPNRFEFGYGLSPEIVRLAHATTRPDVLITVDNGIASHDGVVEANGLGMRVLITDHHLPGTTLPDACCIVNPNQPACGFPSKNLAGVGVIYYVMLALRAVLRARGQLLREVNMASLLDLVALGTVADVVRLDGNNRVLVQQGLKRIRARRMQAGIAALFEVARRDPERAGTYDLGFVLGPRLNAAGRLTDMTLGIEGLITDDPVRARAIAAELDRLNRERREIEAAMQEDALAAMASVAPEAFTATVFDGAWHQGVIGIVASRLKDRFHRPVFAFARGNAGEIRGSGRSIRGLHLRDALDLIARHHPGLILKFGGHAAAAGLSLRELDFERFRAAFEETVRGLVSPSDLERQFECDGPLAIEETTLQSARAIAIGVWGQGFPEPCFFDRFRVVDQRVVGGSHVRLKLARANRVFDAIVFNASGVIPEDVEALYRLDVNEFNGTYGLQLMVQHWRPAQSGTGPV